MWANSSYTFIKAFTMKTFDSSLSVPNNWIRAFFFCICKDTMTSKISIFVHYFSNCIAILCYLDKNVSFDSFIKESQTIYLTI